MKLDHDRLDVYGEVAVYVYVYEYAYGGEAGSKTGLVTVPGKPNDELGPGTLNSILKQAGLKQ
ncbi:type II toxin-antitoxin system HicA family toxin [Candidatus Binatia bacterium]|nr:type II toxin-antitoxin system HicA family toxin [Candidatus Binatia bacterium]